MGPPSRPAIMVAIAAGAGACGALAGIPLPWPYQVVYSALLAGLMAAIAAEDAARMRVPDLLNLLASLAGLTFAWIEAGGLGLSPFNAMLGALLGGALCGGALWLVREAFYRLRNVDGLGLGDVKLGAAAGIWLGWELFAVAVLIAAISALGVIAVHSIAKGPWLRDSRLPFALHLAPAVWLSWYLRQLLGVW